MEQYGKALTMKGDTPFKGSVSHNGTILKIHDNSFVTGFSKLTPAATVDPKFGFGLWYTDSTARNNAVTTVKPLANAVFAGLLGRNPAIASGQPAANNTVLSYNKADRLIEGFIVYKTGFNASTGAEDQGFADITVGMRLYLNDLNGRPRFAAAGSTIAGFTEITSAKIVAVNPDDKSWTVKVTA